MKKIVTESIDTAKNVAFSVADKVKDHKDDLRDRVDDSQESVREVIYQSGVKQWIPHILALILILSWVFALNAPSFGLKPMELVPMTKLSDAVYIVLGVYFGNSMKGLNGNSGQTSRSDRRQDRRARKK